MSLKPIAKTTLCEQVARQIGEMISSGQWKPEDRLPSEAELSKIMGVSRATVREALRSLAFVGLVQMRTGRGTYVAASVPIFIDHLLAHGVLNTEKDLRDLTDARMALETELTALCAERATAEELQQLELVVKEMERARPEGGGKFADLDLEFHMGVATYSKSQVLAKLLRTIRSLLQEFIAKSAQMPGDRDLALLEHQKILEALIEREPRKARSAMRNHLQSFLRGYRLLVGTATPRAQMHAARPDATPSEEELLHISQPEQGGGM